MDTYVCTYIHNKSFHRPKQTCFLENEPIRVAYLPIGYLKLTISLSLVKHRLFQYFSSYHEQISTNSPRQVN